MNPISKACDDIKFIIPRPILQTVFTRRELAWRNTPVNIDAQMMLEVIRPRVLIDCNLIGGVESIISLKGLEAERTNNFTIVYRIPKERTQGRSIISVLNVTFSDPFFADNTGVAVGCGASPLMTMGQAVLDASSPVPIVSTASVQLIGENVVMIKDTAMLPSNIYLRCMIANEENMNNLQLKSYRHFSKLVEYAIKAFIYNEYIIKLGEGELIGGQVLGKFKEIIESYSESEELYQTYLREKMQKVLLMNDRESHQRLLKTLIGGPR